MLKILTKSLTISLALFLTACSTPPPAQEPLQLNAQDVQRGQALAHGLAACGSCHGATPKDATSLLSGGAKMDDKYGELQAPSLMSKEVQSLSLKQIASAIRKSETSDDHKFSAIHHTGYHWMSDRDVNALAAYIKSLPTKESEISRRELSSFSFYTKGILEFRPNVQGYVPLIPEGQTKAYGNYLVDNVARCSSCHNSPESLFSSAKYLIGGSEQTVSDKTLLAPNITNSDTYGIGEWGISQITQYLKTGKTPNGEMVDVRFCPIDYFRRASDSELNAIATYLKSVSN